MFTGLVRAVGTLASVRDAGGGKRIGVDLAGLDPAAAAPGASVCVGGVCLTVVEARGGVAAFDVAAETARRSTFARARAGRRVNLEPALRMGDALDGHWVLGHVDATARLLARHDARGSTVCRFELPAAVGGWVAEKGSVAVDGISLTVSALADDWFEVSVIPETLARTTLGDTPPGEAVNLEADALARYVARWLDWRARRPLDTPPALPDGAGLTEDALRENGFL